MSTHKVVVVVPAYRFPLTAEEEVSVQHLHRYLSDFEIVLAVPEGFVVDHPELVRHPAEQFAKEYFANIGGYNRLMLSREFYSRFQNYEYILIYQLDCLVFSSDLLQWCERGWDYVGSPWFPGFRDDTHAGLWATGNGGFSLRRTSRFLEVLTSRRRAPAGPTKFSFRPPAAQQAFLRLKDWAYARGYKSSINYVLKNYSWNEDGFWSFEARHFAPDFRVPPPQEALPFAFEYAPRFCFEQNGKELPFGCHAWSKTDPDFWRPFLLEQTEGVQRHR